MSVIARTAKDVTRERVLNYLHADANDAVAHTKVKDLMRGLRLSLGQVAIALAELEERGDIVMTYHMSKATSVVNPKETRSDAA